MYPYVDVKVLKDTYSGDGDKKQRFVAISATKKWEACPHCGDKKIGLKEKATVRNIIDVDEDGIPTTVQVVGNDRWECASCHKTFNIGILPECIRPESCKFTQDLLSAAVDAMVSYDATLGDVAKRYMIKSARTIANALDQRILDFQINIKDLKACDHLVVYPFKYDDDICYAIWGIANLEGEDEPRLEMLYDIRKAYSAKDAAAFLKKYPFEGNVLPDTDWASFDEEMLASFEEVHPYVNTAILRSFLEKTITDGPYSSGSISRRKISIEIANLLRICQLGESDTFFETLDEWWEELNETDEDGQNVFMQAVFGGVYQKLNRQKDAIINTLDFSFEDESLGEKTDIMDYNMRFVSKFQKAHIRFEVMRYRIYQSVALRNNEGLSGKHLLSSKYPGTSIHGFYIDLKQVNDIFENVEEEFGEFWD